MDGAYLIDTVDEHVCDMGVSIGKRHSRHGDEWKLHDVAVVLNGELKLLWNECSVSLHSRYTVTGYTKIVG